MTTTTHRFGPRATNARRGAGGSTVFLTGVTGFVGKVTLEALMRQQRELNIEKVYVLIRAKRGLAPRERFDDKVARALCFDDLPADWRDRVRVVGGELTEADCGLSDLDLARVLRDTTHIIHCAASVDFHLPIAEAAAANITASMEVLSVAKRCKQLQACTVVSTAYVTPHRGRTRPVLEELAELPFDPEEAYASILRGEADEKAMMRQTGHPNTYTLTKCINEHLIARRFEGLPLTIVRPSIISAAWREPFAGWVDSHAAFAGFIGLIGAGRLRALVANPATKLDIVPCDIVVDRILRSTLEVPAPAGRDKPLIRHAVAGLRNSCRVDEAAEIITEFFREHPIDRRPGVAYIGPARRRYKAHRLARHTAPSLATEAALAASGKRRLARRLRRVNEKVEFLNEAFPYFTSRTFDFRSSMPLDDPEFHDSEYIRLCCRGAYRHLMRKDERQMPIAGRRGPKTLSDTIWTATQPEGNWAIRTFALTLTKALRRCTDEVTFDRASFESAWAAAPDNSLVVLIPSHRSYMDFMLCSYLCFARPDLGVPIPHIAAGDEFSRIPILGKLFEQTHAFYIKRGLGREDEELTRKVHEMVTDNQVLEFFIEGQRSRSRQFLRPKRGLLRALQSTGKPVTVFPIALTYDRVPEEDVFERELGGEPKPPMQLRGLLKWSAKMAAGQVNLGRVHVTCGTPQVLSQTCDVYAFSTAVMSELQKHTATTSHHLRAFLQHNPILGADAGWLAEQIEARGGHVLDSRRRGEEGVSATTERNMRFQWKHHFYPEARALWPDHPAIAHHTAANGFAAEAPLDPSALQDRRVEQLLHAVFDPIIRDYATAADMLGDPEVPLGDITPTAIVKQAPGAYLPCVQDAFDDLVARRILAWDRERKVWSWGLRARDIHAYRDAVHQRPHRKARFSPVIRLA